MNGRAIFSRPSGTAEADFSSGDFRRGLFQGFYRRGLDTQGVALGSGWAAPLGLLNARTRANAL